MEMINNNNSLFTVWDGDKCEMSKTLIWILTKTMIPRAIAMAIAGALVAWGLLGTTPIEREMYTNKGEKIIVKETPQNLVGEALTLLIVGGLSLFIEQSKATEVNHTQNLIDNLTPPDYEVKMDGLSWSEDSRSNQGCRRGHAT